jgi:hypothetical protein
VLARLGALVQDMGIPPAKGIEQVDTVLALDAVLHQSPTAGGTLPHDAP